MDIRRLYSLLRSYRISIASAVVLAALTAIAAHHLMPERYSARATVVVDSSGINPATGTPTGQLGGSVASQVEIAQSERVLGQAAQGLSTAARQALLRRETDAASPASGNEQVMKSLRRQVVVAVGKDSQVLQFTGTASQPALAAELANRVADAYLSISLALRTDPARQRAAFYEQRVSELQEAARDAQDRLAAFQSKTGLVSATDRSDADQALLVELMRSTSELKAQYLGTAARRIDAESSPRHSQEVLGSGIVQAMQVDVSRARARVQELANRLGANHPQYQAAVEEANELQASLDKEVAKTAISVSASGRADLRSVDRLGAVVDRQKSLMLDLTAKREELGVLQHRADYARKSLEAMRDRLNDTLTEGRSKIGVASMLAAAEPPSESNAVPMAKSVPLAALLGFVIVGFGIVTREQYAPKLRAQTDLVQLGMRILACIPTAAIAAPAAPSSAPAGASIGMADRRLGAILSASGKLLPAERDSVFDEHVRANEPFGSVAVRLGYVNEADIHAALAVQYGLHRFTEVRADAPPAQFVVDHHPTHPVAEAVRALRSELVLLMERDAQANTIAVTSPDRGDGKSFIAANLAIAFSQAGIRTLLIEADLRDPQLAARFGSSRREGLSSYLAGLCEQPRVMTLDEAGMLSILPAGPRPPNPQELLCNPRFPHMVAQIREQYDVTIIDTPAASVGSDAQIIAARAGTALIVGRWTSTSLDGLASWTSRLTDAGVKIAGSVINRY